MTQRARARLRRRPRKEAKDKADKEEIDDIMANMDYEMPG